MSARTYRPKPCGRCRREFTPTGPRNLYCRRPDCKPTGPAAPPDGQVRPDTLLSLLERVKAKYKGAAPEQIKTALAAFVDARHEGERQACASALLDAAAVAIVLADRPERLAMGKPVLRAPVGGLRPLEEVLASYTEDARP